MGHQSWLQISVNIFLWIDLRVFFDGREMKIAKIHISGNKMLKEVGHSSYITAPPARENWPWDHENKTTKGIVHPL